MKVISVELKPDPKYSEMFRTAEEEEEEKKTQ